MKTTDECDRTVEISRPEVAVEERTLTGWSDWSSTNRSEVVSELVAETHRDVSQQLRRGDRSCGQRCR